MKKALESVPGVASVTTDIDARTASLEVDPDTFDVQQAIEAVKEAGFESSVANTAAG